MAALTILLPSQQNQKQTFYYVYYHWNYANRDGSSATCCVIKDYLGYIK